MKGLLKYIGYRLLSSVVMIFIMVTLVFFLLRVLPGDPVQALTGGKAPPEVVQQLREQLGLNLPIYKQYIRFLSDVIHGNLGTSIVTGENVKTELLERFPATFELAIVSVILSAGFGIVLGIESAKREGTLFDFITKLVALSFYAIPIFFVGIVMQYIFGVKLGWFPISGRIDPLNEPDKVITGLYLVDTLLTHNFEGFVDALKHIVLPAFSLALVLFSVIYRITRGNMILQLKKEYVKAARARGLKERRVVYYHAFKNAFIPIFTLIGLQFASLLGGAILTENVFSWPGLGSYLIERIGYRDFPAIQGAILFYAVIVVFISIGIDIICALINPKIKYE
ncbi:ABC transporter permease [Desulfurobacterium atlanticum]|uniref:Peptide/nickel transport system permease protein n=1 Tax=Desulfurobacterium atlanticum TaxID=240169 RepID=A0A238YEH1_9BACT|nr:ABC transporter permease [Desulfurobacterium atlanticum]SNR69362.1 peptide/nickel transport system permease protein [Desulfurobacterium atlanticum]